ncbi:MAG: hypothetical protein EBR81_17395, partial [Proteobacteria bacterium]|nr:hypothetical protein [Pseudomonadota bacterium]
VIGINGDKGSGKDTLCSVLAKHVDVERIAFGDALKDEAADFLSRHGLVDAALSLMEKNCTPEVLFQITTDSYGAVAPAFDPAVFAAVQDKTADVRFFANLFAECSSFTHSAWSQSVRTLMDSPTRKESFRVLLQWWGTEYRRNQHLPSYWTDIVQDKIAVAKSKGKVVVLTDVRFPNEYDVPRLYQDNLLVKVIRPKDGEAKDAHISENALANHEFDVTIVNDGTLEVYEQKIVAYFNL